MTARVLKGDRSAIFISPWNLSFTLKPLEATFDFYGDYGCYLRRKMIENLF